MAKPGIRSEPPLRPKPLLRGTSHLVALIGALFAAGVLVGSAETDRARFGALVYGLSLAAMLGASAIYHRTNFKPSIQKWFERLDHSAIFLFIAGTYTPLAMLLERWGTAVLIVAWSMAALGVLRALFWVDAPHWLSVAQYLLMGWAIVPFVGEVYAAVGPSSILLLAIGGLLYTLGAVVFARKRPDPYPETFGFHEVFHAFVVAAVVCHFIVVIRVVGLLEQAS